MNLKNILVKFGSNLVGNHQLKAITSTMHMQSKSHKPGEGF